MDDLYIGDIPLNNSDDVYLYFDDDGYPVICENPQHFTDEQALHNYKLFYNLQQNKFFYESFATDKVLINNKHFIPVKVSHKWYDRSDSLNILSFSCVIMLVVVFCFNIVTSVFKKGGLLSGLF